MILLWKYIRNYSHTFNIKLPSGLHYINSLNSINIKRIWCDIYLYTDIIASAVKNSISVLKGINIYSKSLL